jgi:hypothetical protein
VLQQALKGGREPALIVMAWAREDIGKHDYRAKALGGPLEGRQVIHTAWIHQHCVKADTGGQRCPRLQVAHCGEVLGLPRLRTCIQDQDPAR